MATNRYCDGVSRRDVLRAGLVTPFGTGLSLAGFLRLMEGRSPAADTPTATGAGVPRRGPTGQGSGFGKATNAIFVNLGGGPTHLDTFDMKPDAPEDYRGEFRPIPTVAPGVSFCEHLPLLAKQADKFAVLRGVSHTLAAHELGTKYMNTGNRPLPSLEFPGYGAVTSKEKPGARDLPPFVAIPNTPQVAGYLGVEFAPFSTTSAPRAGQPFSVRGISLGRGLTVAEVDKRRALLNDLDATFRGYEKDSDLVHGLDRFGQRAYDIISSPRSRQAFDLAKESPSIAGLFNASPIAQSCLLATRLVEAGVRFVTVSSGGWDTHQNNFASLKDRLLPELDSALSGLFQSLQQKGLLETTAVFVTGEFGRTPKVNGRGGRDHYPRAMFCLMGGGGIRGGQVVGASDDKGTGPASGDGITPDEVAATFYHALGIDAAKEYRTPTGRPVAIVRNGAVLTDLFG